MTTKSSACGNKRKLVNVLLLDGTEYSAYVDVKAKFQEVFNQVTGHLCLRETEYFGLAFNKDHEYQFVVLEDKVHKLAPKHWKSGSGEGLDSQGKAIMNVCFRVQFYVDQVILLREKVTRHQYYLQLKDNVLQYNHVYSEEKCFQQAAYALQADFGNYIRDKHRDGYFSPAAYFPHWIVQRHGLDYLAHNVPTLHTDLHNMTRNDAELRYIKHASMPPGALNLHFYVVRRRKTDKTCNTWLAVCAKGVEVYEDDAGYKNHVSTFLWRDIGKLYFDKKKFEIRTVQSAGGRRFVYYTDSDVKSKYLLHICRSTHMFQMAIQPKLMEIQHLDNEDQKRYRESYVSSDPRDRSHLHHSPSTSTNASVSSNNQRLSLVSDTSSNTTSGIVSDRMAASFDEDDHSRELMIDCPARLPKQMRSKFQIFSSFNHSPSYSHQASPSHSLEVCQAAGRSGSTQELSAGGSWRARHSHTSGCLMGTAGLPLPYPTTQNTDSNSNLQPGRSAAGKDNFGQRFLGSVLQTVDRNTSGDSAVSVSGVFTDLDQLSQSPPEQQMMNGASGDVVAASDTSFSHTPAINQPTSPRVLSFASSSSELCSPKVLAVHKSLQPLLDVDKRNSPHAEVLPEYLQSVASCTSDSEQTHYRQAHSVNSMGKLSKPSGEYSDIHNERHQLLIPAQDTLGIQQASRMESCVVTCDDESIQTGQESLRAQVCGKSQQSSLDVASKPENQHIVPAQVHKHSESPAAVRLQHIVQAQVHQHSESPAAVRLQQMPAAVTDHYLMALQQGSGNLLEQTMSSRWGTAVDHMSTVVHVQEQLPSEHIQSQPVELADCVQEAEHKKQKVYKKDQTGEEKQLQTDTDASTGTHGKANLHPELKQILGQSHGFSLPLMTALCNDSSLMDASRSQSGSRSSYETSTVRSSDSRLTRLSHDTDSRRWSSCCQGANMPDVLLIQSSRPYSWHSEHFELDSQLAVPSSDHLPPTSPANLRTVNNKHINVSTIHHNILPQKMIVSDPGPSSPRLLTMGEATCWWEASPNAADTEGILSSWTGIIPYSLPAHHQTSRQQLNHQQMVPHKLSSGGHRDSETSIAHKQVMTENIGIA